MNLQAKQKALARELDAREKQLPDRPLQPARPIATATHPKITDSTVPISKGVR